MFAGLETAEDLFALKRGIRDRALQLIDTHFEKCPEAVTNERENEDNTYIEAIIEADVTDRYGDSAEIIKLSADGYTVRHDETCEHCDMTYGRLDTDVLLQVVQKLEEVALEQKA